MPFIGRGGSSPPSDTELNPHGVSASGVPTVSYVGGPARQSAAGEAGSSPSNSPAVRRLAPSRHELRPRRSSGAPGTGPRVASRDPRGLRWLPPDARRCICPRCANQKTKELIALAIAVSKQCDGCIASHARGAARAGATESEVAEALGVTIAMNGGPATVYGARAFAAFREFAEETDTQKG